MPTKDPVKNREYVKKSQEKRKASVGVEQFNKDHTAAQMKHKEKVKSQDIEKFKKEQAEYMKEYMKQRRLKEKQEKNKANAVNTITDAIRARKARKEMLNLSIEKANKQIIEIAKEPAKRPVGRPKKPRNPVGRPKGSKNKKQ